MKTIVIVCVLIFAFQVEAVCQNNKENLDTYINRKNVIYATYGLMPNIVSDLNYERQIYLVYKSSIYLRIGYGNYKNENGIAKMGLISTSFIYGLHASHFEFGVGAAYLYDIERMNFYKKTEIQPIFNMGLRYMQENGPFVFRLGAGWPECFYASVGCAF
jgi:hypothetical protein